MWAEQATAGSSSCDDQLDDWQVAGSQRLSERKNKRRRMRSDRGDTRGAGGVPVARQSTEPMITQPGQYGSADQLAVSRPTGETIKQNAEQNVND